MACFVSIWHKSVTFTRKARFFLGDHLLIARCLGRHVHSHTVVALLSARVELKLSCQKIQPFDLHILQRAVKVHSQEWPRMLAEEFEAGGCGAGRGPPRKPSGPPRVCSLGYSQASDPPRSPTGSPGTIGTFGLLDIQRMAMKVVRKL